MNKFFNISLEALCYILGRGLLKFIKYVMRIVKYSKNCSFHKSLSICKTTELKITNTVEAEVSKGVLILGHGN